MTEATDLRLPISDSIGEVAAFLLRPPDAWLLYVLAHGAGAGMRHQFLEQISASLAARGVATFRYQFPYMESGRGRPDAPSLLEATVRAAVTRAGEIVPELPVIAGGKSLGGRMTSSAAAAEPLDRVRGLAFLGFPLHPPGQPGTLRAEHLHQVNAPMLFLQGTRDAFARLDLITEVCRGLERRATLRVIEGADHSFGVLKRSGRTPGQVHEELAGAIADWARALAGAGVRP
ncbi:MAG TPA: alpha/beta family hydrolase [Gemmatimonadales bacterium]|nr:alpha/beta family hydrolase [Gemmatimonadales bacterium]